MGNADYTVLGTSIPRMGGVERVTGAGIFGVDLVLPDAARGGVLRSQYAHAKIISIDTREAQSIPGVYAIVTAQDAPDVMYGRTCDDRYILAREKVRYLGDPVAAVAADCEATLRKALKKIKVKYEPLPVVLDSEAAMKPDAPLLHEDMPPPENLPKGAQVKNVFGYEVIHEGDPDKAMAEADLVVEEVYETTMIHPQYLEPRMAAARHEVDGKLTIWVNAQSPFPVRSDVSKTLNIPVSKLRVLVTEIGGGFGGKGCGIHSGASIEAICGLLAIKAKKPVMIVMDKAEETISTTIRAGAKMWVQTGVKKDGTLVARKAKVIYDGGAYSGFGAFALFKAVYTLASWYLVPNVHVEGYVAYTNKQVCGPVRSPGGPQATFAVESQMDTIAAKLGMDPVEFRLKNVPKAGDRIGGIPKLSEVSLGETIRIAAERIGWGKVKLAKNQGIGIATGFLLEEPGPGGGAVVKINEDGTATVLIGKVDFGTSPRFGIPMIVAEELGIPVEDVTVLNVDTDTCPWDQGTVGSRSMLVSGNAVRLAAIDARNELLKIAEKQMEVNRDDLEIKDRYIRVKGTHASALALAKVATRAHKEIGDVIGRGYYDANVVEAEEKERGNSPPFATHAAIVEVDPDTGRVKILKYVAVHDVGFVVHPQAVEGQIEGATVMGMGQALCEQVRFDEKGKTLNSTFVDYLMPTLNMIPKIETVLVKGYSGAGPYGTKGAGENGIVLPPAAIANAIYNAVGVRLTKLPLSPENVLRALREQKRPAS